MNVYWASQHFKDLAGIRKAWAAPRSSSSTCSTGRSSGGCANAGCSPERRLVGSYITSLEMAGASLTLLELDDELTALWDAPVHTPALRWGR